MRHFTMPVDRIQALEHLLVIASMVLAVSGAPSSSWAQGSREHRVARLQRDCPIAAQALASTSGLSSDAMFETISECDDTGPAILATLWAAPPSDAHQLDRLVRSSAILLDQRLFDAIIARARNTGSPRAPRVAALRVLATYLDKYVVISQRALETPTPDTTVTSLFGTSSGAVGQRVGTHPLSGTYASEIRALLQSLVNDPDPIVRQDGRNFVNWLRQEHVAPQSNGCCSGS